MLRSYLLVASGMATASLALFAAACGGTTDTAGTGGRGSGSGGGSTAVHAEPPDAPPAKDPDGAVDVTFALKKLYLGDTNPDGTPGKGISWKQYGYDLDGKISTAASKDLCKPRNNAPASTVYPD